jgi:hypothetical protein
MVVVSQSKISIGPNHGHASGQSKRLISAISIFCASRGDCRRRPGLFGFGGSVSIKARNICVTGFMVLPFDGVYRRALAPARSPRIHRVRDPMTVDAHGHFLRRVPPAVGVMALNGGRQAAADTAAGESPASAGVAVAAQKTIAASHER